MRRADLYYERNILRMLSREGPKAAVADVNKVNLMMDYWSNERLSRTSYLQNLKEAFTKSDQRRFHKFSEFEDESKLFFDADNDERPYCFRSFR